MLTSSHTLHFSSRARVDVARCIRIPYSDDDVYNGDRILIVISFAPLDGNYLETVIIRDDDGKLLIIMPMCVCMYISTGFRNNHELIHCLSVPC